MALGALNTWMLDEVLAAGSERVGQAFFDRMVKTKAEGGTPLETGAALRVSLDSSASDGITGRLLSAVWDPWADLPVQWAELEKTDIYTLRRIVPRIAAGPECASPTRSVPRYQAGSRRLSP